MMSFKTVVSGRLLLVRFHMTKNTLKN